jgi:hypothetical protein
MVDVGPDRFAEACVLVTSLLYGIWVALVGVGWRLNPSQALTNG